MSLKEIEYPFVSGFPKESRTGRHGSISLSISIFIPTFILFIFIFNEGIYFKELTHDHGG